MGPSLLIKFYKDNQVLTIWFKSITDSASDDLKKEQISEPGPIFIEVEQNYPVVMERVRYLVVGSNHKVLSYWLKFLCKTLHSVHKIVLIKNKVQRVRTD